MPALTLAARLLAANTEDRTLEYLILPFGEVGRTSLGAVTVDPGVLELPDDPTDVVLNKQHDRSQPVGTGRSLIEGEDGIRGTFDVLPTTAGDDLLVEAKAGLRAGASVEIDNPVIRGGRLLAGRLTAVAAVLIPAFPSATLTAADCGDLPNKETSMPTTAQTAAASAAVETAPVEEETTVETPETAPAATTAAETASPALVAARAPIGVQTPATLTAARAVDVRTVSQMLASIASQEGGSRLGVAGPRLLAALDQLTVADAMTVATPESFEGKIWQGREYDRQFEGLVTIEGLDKLRYRGWKWDVDDVTGAQKKPTMAAYGGFPAEPPTNEVKAIEHTWEPGLIAWAGQMDRRYRDFSDPEFWSAFFTAVATSYAKVTDEDTILAGLVAEASQLDLVLTEKPADVPEGVWKLVKGIRAVKPYGMPTGAVLEGDLWEEIMFTKQDNVLPYLQLALGVKEGQALNFTIQPDDEVLTPGDVLVTVKQAAKFRELPGSPIRVDAEVIAKGGIEQGVFGYAGLEVLEPNAILLVNDTTV